MNILFIDRPLPSSLFSGKSVHMINIYGCLAKKHRIIFLKANDGHEASEAPEMRQWADQTFFKILELPKIENGKWYRRAISPLMFRPWYDWMSKHPEQIKPVQDYLFQVAEQYQIDIVLTHDQEVAQYGLLLADRYCWVQDLADSMILQMERRIQKAESVKEYASLRWRHLREKRFEKEMVEESCLTTFVAEDDACRYRQNGSKLAVIPNGVDVDYFNPNLVKPIESKKPYVVFTGHMSFAPNHDAAIYFAKDIYPELKRNIPSLEFKIVGANPKPELLELKKMDGIEVTGRVPDIRPYLSGAVAFVCPMRMGSGIKNKILEAMAMKLPVLASGLALNGFTNFPSGSVFQVEKISEYISVLRQFLKEPESRKKMGDLAREVVSSKYSWQKTVAAYEKVFRETFEEYKAQ